MVDTTIGVYREIFKRSNSLKNVYGILLVLIISLCACGNEGTKMVGENSVLEASDKLVWEKVQNILVNTKEIVVLDGIQRVSSEPKEGFAGDLGDWMVRHMLSDPQNLNPYTSNDAGSSQVLRHIFETLLYAENEPPYALKGKLAVSYPKVSNDKLSYTFKLR